MPAFHFAEVAIMLLRSILVLLLFAFVNRAHAESEGYSFPTRGRNILPAALGKLLLRPCSRPAPNHITRFWEPSEKDIDVLEEQLLPYMSSLEQAGSALPPAGPYDRQFVGIIIRGKKLIYGNFFPPGFRDFDPSHQAIDVCDGGPKHWGIVFDPKRRTFSDLSFGSIG